jgi:hypothetical protein
MKCPRLSLGPKSQVITLTLVLLWTLGLSTVAAAQGQKLLYAFQSPPDGSFPQGGVVADKAGNLYGTTQFGFGTVYELSPPTVSGGAWTETILYTFTGSDGGGPGGPRSSVRRHQCSNYNPLCPALADHHPSSFEFRFLALPTRHSTGASNMPSRLNSLCCGV